MTKIFSISKSHQNLFHKFIPKSLYICSGSLVLWHMTMQNIAALLYMLHDIFLLILVICNFQPPPHRTAMNWGGRRLACAFTETCLFKLLLMLHQRASEHAQSENTNFPPLHIQVHRIPWLVSVATFDRWESNTIPFSANLYVGLLPNILISVATHS